VLRLDLEGHGREQLDRNRSIDVTRTVGWFTSVYPVRLAMRDRADPVATASAVHRHLDRIPDNGIGYGLLRYLTGPDGAALTDRPESAVSFNYLGWFDGARDGRLFGPPLQIPAPLQSADAPRRYLLEVVITGSDGSLRVELVYARDFLTPEAVQGLADRFGAEMTEMGRLLATAPGPVDAAHSREFPLMAVDAHQMSIIAGQLGT
jgi:non-ribosomal peptide synthase protein (TIGR01720 family)